MDTKTRLSLNDAILNIAEGKNHLDEADNTAAIAKQVKQAVKKYTTGKLVVRSKGGKTRFIAVIAHGNIDNKLRVMMADVMYPKANIKNRDDISYGNISDKIISASADVWVKALGLKESVELDEASQRFGGDTNIPADKKTKAHIESGKALIHNNVLSTLHKSARFVVIRNPNKGSNQDGYLMATISDPMKGRIKMFAYHGSHPSISGAMKFAKQHKLVPPNTMESVELDEATTEFAVVATASKMLIKAFPTEKQARQYIKNQYRRKSLIGNLAIMEVPKSRPPGNQMKGNMEVVKESVDLNERKYVKLLDLLRKRTKEIEQIDKAADKSGVKNPSWRAVVLINQEIKKEVTKLEKAGHPVHSLKIESVELDEGKQLELLKKYGTTIMKMWDKEGASSDEIAKKLKLNSKDTKTLKGLMDESVELDEKPFLKKIKMDKFSRSERKKKKDDKKKILKYNKMVGIASSYGEDLDESKMSEFHMLVKEGKTAQQIAKIMKIDLKTVKALMKDMNEAKSDYTITATKNKKIVETMPVSKREIKDVVKFLKQSHKGATITVKDAKGKVISTESIDHQFQGQYLQSDNKLNSILKTIIDID
jgi:DNA-binding CsgD family transcriptional regulator